MQLLFCVLDTFLSISLCYTKSEETNTTLPLLWVAGVRSAKLLDLCGISREVLSRRGWLGQGLRGAAWGY